MDPYYSLILLYGLYAWSAAGYAVWVIPGTFDSSILRGYYVAINLGLVFFAVGYHIVARRISSPPAPVDGLSANVIDGRFGLSLAAAMLFSLAIVPKHLATFDFRTVQAYTDVAASWRLDLRDDSSSGVRAYISGLPAVYATALLMFVGCRVRYRSLRWITGGLLCYVIALSVMRGEKAPLLAVVLFIVLYHHYRRKPVRLVHIAVPALVVYVFAVMISHVRSTTNIMEMLSAGATIVTESPELLLPINAGELNGPPQTLLVVMDDVLKQRPAFIGLRHYSDELQVWIPRALDPTRPRPLSEQYMERFFHVEDDQGRGRGMFIVTPGFWALGFPGLAMEMTLYGMIVAAVYRRFRAAVQSDAVVLVYSQCVFVLAFMAVRTGLVGTLRAAVMATVPFVPPLVWAGGGFAYHRRSERAASVTEKALGTLRGCG